MAAVKAQVVLKTVDNVSENFVSNTFCFDGPDPISEVTGIMSALTAFYNSVGTNLLGVGITAGPHEVKFYDMPGVKPNYPVFTGALTLSGAPGGAILPPECALVLSFQGQKAPGFPQRRRRGRIYIGPIKASLNTDGRPTSSAVSSLAAYGANLRTAINALPGSTQWSVWSTVDQQAVAVNDGWVDNEWDTQRRRGLRRTSRSVFP